MIRLWTLIFKGNSIWLRKVSSKTDLKIAIKNVRKFGVILEGCVSWTVIFPSGLLYYQLCEIPIVEFVSPAQ